MGKYCVVTTINPPTTAIEELHKRFGENLIIVGDNKTPIDWSYNDCTYLQAKKNLSSTKNYRNVDNHYARKNLGYMEAFRNGATMIYDTDDDNIPNTIWKLRTYEVSANESVGFGWYNAYSLFCSTFIWPRGFSLRDLTKVATFGERILSQSSIQQGLSDGEPDVDAIWRLVFQKHNTFDVDLSLYVDQGAWCPFNSQTTWWFPKAFPLMYLPIYSSFRMTDIWRSFVAQRCLWELGEGVTFHSPSEVYQDRNEHDYLVDFKDEVPGYLNNDKIIEILTNIELEAGEDAVCDNLLKCYKSLVEKDILPKEEVESVSMWIEDYKEAMNK